MTSAQIFWTLIAGILSAYAILWLAKAITREIAREWFGAKRRHHLQVMKDCEQANGEG